MVLSDSIKQQLRQYVQATWALGSHWNEATWLEASIAHLNAMKANISSVPKKVLRDSVRYYRYIAWNQELKGQEGTPGKGATRSTPQKPLILNKGLT